MNTSRDITFHRACFSQYVDYEAKGTTRKGYTVIVVLEQYDVRNSREYHVMLACAKKRKDCYRFLGYIGGQDRLSLQQTGDGTLDALIFAREAINVFIDTRLRSGDSIVVGADDSRRFKVYYRGLRSMGFKKQGNKNILIYTHP